MGNQIIILKIVYLIRGTICIVKPEARTRFCEASLKVRLCAVQSRVHLANNDLLSYAKHPTWDSAPRSPDFIFMSVVYFTPAYDYGEFSLVYSVVDI